MAKLLYLFFLSLLIIKAFCNDRFDDIPREEIYKLVEDHISEKYGKGLNYMYNAYVPDSRAKAFYIEVTQLANGYSIGEKAKIYIKLKDYSLSDNLEFVLNDYTITDNLEFVSNARERYIEGKTPMNLEEFIQFFIDKKFGGQYKADLSKYTVQEGGGDSKGEPHYYTLTNVDFIDEADLGYKNNEFTVYEFYQLVPGYTDLYELYYYAGANYSEKDCSGYIAYGVFAYTREVKVDELFCYRG
ncbi:hypothetical protein BCR36DRAFT_588400 [Piromyces finnis]|uniref:Uncharacterized protein n=1 Tax=Piromyces finnis TaxID=1754191 RepID=A0A1Y1UK24_9FUNG|nr:hypothetical protein BCR36DRAFT_588400 [Piromyces finnis]|eukprot:ORX37475.1 hypothetical protein BCR36DRAFT_588400 [Piromyces finnis]